MMSSPLMGQPRAYPLTPPPSAPPAHVRLPLHDELYLLAHDEDSGAPRIHTGSLAVGLAGAALVDLLLDHSVSLWNGRIHPDLPSRRRDPIGGAAIGTLRSVPALPGIEAWLRAFAAAGLYERVRANLLAVGILRHQRRKMRADVYAPVHTVWAVRIRGHIRSVLYGYEQPDPHRVALCGLVDTLGIHEYLSLSEPGNQIRYRLRQVASADIPPVRHVLTAVESAVGDLATAVYR